MLISIIAAIGQNGELGANNDLLWRVPADMRQFRLRTTGHCVLMGRRTFESLKVPLKRRKNLVLSKSGVSSSSSSSEFLFFQEFEAALAWARGQGEEELFLIGGRQVYAAGLAQAQRLYLSRIAGEYPQADVYFPALDWSVWRLQSSQVYEAEGEVPAWVFEEWHRIQ